MEISNSSSLSISLDSVRAGNAEAWSRVCDHFKVGLVAKANQLLRRNRIVKKISSEDVVQETYLKAWKLKNSFRGNTVAEFAKWLLCILRTTFYDFCRANDLEETMYSGFDSVGNVKTPSKLFVSSEREAMLYYALGEIDSTAQKVIALRHFEGLKFSEVAELLKMNPNSVASVYRRNIKKLQEFIDAQQG